VITLANPKTTCPITVSEAEKHFWVRKLLGAGRIIGFEFPIVLGRQQGSKQTPAHPRARVHREPGGNKPSPGAPRLSALKPRGPVFSSARSPRTRGEFRRLPHGPGLGRTDVTAPGGGGLQRRIPAARALRWGPWGEVEISNCRRPRRCSCRPVVVRATPGPVVEATKSRVRLASRKRRFAASSENNGAATIPHHDAAHAARGDCTGVRTGGREQVRWGGQKGIHNNGMVGPGRLSKQSVLRGSRRGGASGLRYIHLDEGNRKSSWDLGGAQTPSVGVLGGLRETVSVTKVVGKRMRLKRSCILWKGTAALSAHGESTATDKASHPDFSRPETSSGFRWRGGRIKAAGFGWIAAFFFLAYDQGPDLPTRGDQGKEPIPDPLFDPVLGRAWIDTAYAVPCGNDYGPRLRRTQTNCARTDGAKVDFHLSRQAPTAGRSSIQHNTWSAGAGNGTRSDVKTVGREAPMGLGGQGSLNASQGSLELVAVAAHRRK